ncbi:butyrophilin subfamily 3 member A2-like isoform X3 [Mugil cephalus]|uniref:butyrophilin subfamily 3 member A2-like isoform X3 n=1 Tax=Mugil cephalus TaxID=48193 RepID=UPI001FB7F400|nr:butyrophilin subfamily 3 member A2-like isoform X3 [Mugil cephalus]
MFLLQRSWTEMELLPLVCFCLLTCSGTTFGDEGPLVTTRMVKLNGEVILPCSFSTIDITAETFDWRKEDMKEVFMYAAGSHYNNGRPGQDPYFKGRVFHFDDQLQSGNASIVIRNIKKTDSGRYSCIFPFPQPGRTRSIIELIVDCILKDRTKENKPGSSPEPSVTILPGTSDQALLQCKVQGAFPKPKVQWLDSDNNTVTAEEPQVTESEGKYNIILKTTVKKSDVYRCVSTQEEICHQVYQNIQVPLQEKTTAEPVTQGFSVGVVAALVVIIVILVIVLAVVLYFKRNPKGSLSTRTNSDKREADKSGEAQHPSSDKHEALRLEKSDKELINNEEETIVLSSGKTDGDRS